MLMALFPCHHSLILKGRWINLKWKLDLITIFMWTVCSLPSALRIKSKLHDMLWNSFTPQPICYHSLIFLGDLGKKNTSHNPWTSCVLHASHVFPQYSAFVVIMTVPWALCNACLLLWNRTMLVSHSLTSMPSK